KHPARTRNISEEVLTQTRQRNSGNAEQEALSISSVRAALLKAKPGSAPGPDGRRLDHYKDMIRDMEDPASTRLLEALTYLYNVICRGIAPTEVYELLAQARLVALSKPEKATDIRPIAVGLADRRLLSSSLGRQHKETISDFLSFLQLGDGVAGGAEAIRHYRGAGRELHRD